MLSLNYSQTLKIGIVAIWLILLALLVKRDILIEKIDFREIQALENAGRVEFQGVYFQNKKIGYVQTIYTPNPDQTINIEQNGYLVLNILETSHPINLHLIATLDQESRLKRFSLSFKSYLYQMNAIGIVDSRQVKFTLTTNNSVINDTIELSDTPMLSTTRRGYLLRSDMHVGDKIKVPWFDPISLSGKDSIVEYKGKNKVLINQRVFNLHQFLEKIDGARVNIWLNDQGKVIKEESPTGFVFIQEPEFRATQLDSTSNDLLAAVSVQAKGTIPSLGNRQQMQYRLRMPEYDNFNLNGGRQSLNGDILTVSKEAITADSAPTDISCSIDDNSTLAPTPYIQVNHPQIAQMQKSIVGTETDPLTQVRLLADWVYTNIDKRPVVGLPDALTTLGNRVGDCNEHAALFAALARNTGIPTRFVAGVTFNRNSFYYHAWNEVCISGQWMSVDTTTNQFPADLTHIRFIAGGVKEQMRIGALLGQLGIEIINDTQ